MGHFGTVLVTSLDTRLRDRRVHWVLRGFHGAPGEEGGAGDLWKKLFAFLCLGGTFLLLGTFSALSWSTGAFSPSLLRGTTSANSFVLFGFLGTLSEFVEILLLIGGLLLIGWIVLFVGCCEFGWVEKLVAFVTAFGVASG